MKPIDLVHNKLPLSSRGSRDWKVCRQSCLSARMRWAPLMNTRIWIFSCSASLEVVPPSERRRALKSVQGITHFEESNTAVGWDSQWSPQGDHLRVNENSFEISYNTVDWIRTVVRRLHRRERHLFLSKNSARIRCLGFWKTESFYMILARS